MSIQKEKIPVTAIFDIGKTNKKFFLFDSNFQVLKVLSQTFTELSDDEGFPCDDIQGITHWMKDTLQEVIQGEEYDVQALNFSAYGASFVHLDEAGNLVTPLYNYLKAFPEDLWEQFYAQIGGKLKFELDTSSPALGMLNSGLQLYWLKYRKPELFTKIKYTLHLPQYCSYVFSKKLYSEYTSIGCHTGLWDFEQKDYHSWVKAEEIDRLFPPVVSADTSFEGEITPKIIQIAPGVHDSSAALVPYLTSSSEPFMVISTGTWSICMNPFEDSPLTKYELERDCLHFLGLGGRKVKASRLFLGEEFKYQIQKLDTYFHKSSDYHVQIVFDETLYTEISQKHAFVFPKKYLQQSRFGFSESIPEVSLSEFKNYEAAFHQLLYELTLLQIESLKLVAKNSLIRKLYLDGGFTKNQVFVQMLKQLLPDFIIDTPDFPQGSALGAAQLIPDSSKKYLNSIN
ncbi:MAG: FGGY family carbohydrate kinase [Microscillaceae bacterium]|nr:FGGY family carbohydrate kinase [Microscillaceae bacterium]